MAYTGTLPDMTTLDTSSPDPADEVLKQALGAWVAGRADLAQVAVLNDALRRGRLDRSLDAVAPLITQIQHLESRLDSVPV